MANNTKLHTVGMKQVLIYDNANHVAQEILNIPTRIFISKGSTVLKIILVLTYVINCT